MTFLKDSAFTQAERAVTKRFGEPALVTQADLDEAVQKATASQKQARGDSPVEHWSHDLETIDILLEQKPPDIHRARQLIDDLRREMYQELR